MEEPHWLFDEEAWEEHHSVKEPKLNYDPDDPEPVDDLDFIDINDLP